MICSVCPRNCAVERGRGFCGMGEEPVIARAAPHYDEEPVISGTRGSGAVFFSGCSLKCVFCQNAEISHSGFGAKVSVERLGEIYDELAGKGVHNINLVNPTHFTDQIIESLKGFERLPVVWNTGGYEKKETIERLEGIVDVYLPDLKYTDADLAKRYSRAADYFEYAAPSIIEMTRQRGKAVINDEGIMTSGVIIRHLVLPGQLENSKRALEWIKEHCGNAWVSLMAQYTPFSGAEGIDELGRRLTEDEYEEICDYMFELGIEDGFVQELESGDAKYVPKWDLEGVQRKE